MQIFVRVAELSSFTRAAESLALPKASMSAAVQKLEKLVGARLLHRTTRRVQLTQDGRAF
jgi:DNA-binding transcriptional LysR family regulator